MRYEVGRRVRWDEHIDRYPFFVLSPGEGIVVESFDGLAYILPLDDEERRVIYESWGSDEHEPGDVKAYCLAWTSEDSEYVEVLQK